MSGPLFAPDLANLDLFLSLIGDRQLERTEAGVVLVPAQRNPNALAEEFLASMQVVLQHAWFGAVQWPGKKASYPWAHDPCGSWRMMTTDRAKTKCECGQRGARRRIDIPWVEANHHGRPKGRRQVALP